MQQGKEFRCGKCSLRCGARKVVEMWEVQFEFAARKGTEVWEVQFEVCSKESV